jgi:hypothetical protein
MANKKYGLLLTIGSVTSGALHFLYEAYKVLYAEELLMKKMILKRKIKIHLVNDKRFGYNTLYNKI